jgi:endogenous inhibitor of DNA gyrase (YacG/DUF329 family)
MRDLGNWATERYVVSDRIFDEDEIGEGGGKTVILDLETPNNSNDAER